MDQNQNIPLSSEVIPAGTGLVQAIRCLGTQYDTENGGTMTRLHEQVIAQITTFARGVRRVCCPEAQHGRNGKVACGGNFGAPCTYAWEDPTS